jgi:hypothetical protein
MATCHAIGNGTLTKINDGAVSSGPPQEKSA